MYYVINHRDDPRCLRYKSLGGAAVRRIRVHARMHAWHAARTHARIAQAAMTVETGIREKQIIRSRVNEI